MPESAPILHKFMVYAPDKTEEGTFARRLSVRPRHIEAAKAHHADGSIRLGGWLLSPESLVPEADQKMVGTLFICEADSIEKVKELVETDIYYTAGVWDKEKIVISPFVPASPWP